MKYYILIRNYICTIFCVDKSNIGSGKEMDLEKLSFLTPYNNLKVMQSYFENLWKLLHYYILSIHKYQIVYLNQLLMTRF